MKKPFSKMIAALQSSGAGVTTLEYALVAALIVVGIIAGARALDAAGGERTCEGDSRWSGAR